MLHARCQCLRFSIMTLLLTAPQDTKPGLLSRHSDLQGQGLGQLLVYHMVQCLQQNDVQNIIVFCDSDGEPPSLLYTQPALLPARPCQLLVTASLVPEAPFLAYASPITGTLQSQVWMTEAGLLLQLCPFTDPWALTSRKVGMSAGPC